MRDYKEFHCNDCGKSYLVTVFDGIDRHAWYCDKRLAMQRRIMELEWEAFLRDLAEK